MAPRKEIIMQEQTIHQNNSFQEIDENSDSVVDVNGIFCNAENLLSICSSSAFAGFYERFKERTLKKGIALVESSKEISEMIKENGTSVRLMNPGKPWIRGQLRIRVLLEFSPDLPESNEINDPKKPLTLDDLRENS